MQKTIRPLIFSTIHGVLVPFNGKKKDMYDDRIVKYSETAMYALRELLKYTNGLLILVVNTDKDDVSIINQMFDNGIEVYKIICNPLYSNGQLIADYIYTYTNTYKIPVLYSVLDVENDKYTQFLQNRGVHISSKEAGFTITEARTMIKDINISKEGLINMLKEAIKTHEESHALYREYVDDHRANVSKAFNLFSDLIISYIAKYKRSFRFGFGSYDGLKDSVLANLVSHDRSKYEAAEFAPYAAKFYPCPEDIENLKAVNKKFDEAWTHHYTHNPHHPEYWYEEDAHGKPRYREMSNVYFVEMLLDWISVSMTKESSTYDWWFNHGRNEKVEMLTALDIDLIDEFITTYKTALDFTKN